MPQPELDRLLISNLGDLEAATRHLKTDLMPAVASAINESALEFCRRQDWFGVAEYDTDDIWMAPHEWHVEGGETDAFHCWFALDVSDADWKNIQFWLACMAGVGPKRMGMRWSQNIANKRKLGDQGIRESSLEIISRLRSREAFRVSRSPQPHSSCLSMPRIVTLLANAFGEEVARGWRLAPFERLPCRLASRTRWSDFNALLAMPRRRNKRCLSHVPCQSARPRSRGRVTAVYRIRCISSRFSFFRSRMSRTSTKVVPWVLPCAVCAVRQYGACSFAMAVLNSWKVAPPLAVLGSLVLDPVQHSLEGAVVGRHVDRDAPLVAGLELRPPARRFGPPGGQPVANLDLVPKDIALDLDHPGLLIRIERDVARHRDGRAGQGVFAGMNRVGMLSP